MPAQAPTSPAAVAQWLGTLGHQIRSYRKALGVSATAAAQAAGLSRVTLFRIESGEASVTVGAYLNVLAALGLGWQITAPGAGADAGPGTPARAWPKTTDTVPADIALADYPQLQRAAWFVHGVTTLTAAEARGIYERNARHIDMQAMQPHERRLFEALQAPVDAAAPDV